MTKNKQIIQTLEKLLKDAKETSKEPSVESLRADLMEWRNDIAQYTDSLEEKRQQDLEMEFSAEDYKFLISIRDILIEVVGDINMRIDDYFLFFQTTAWAFSKEIAETTPRKRKPHPPRKEGYPYIPMAPKDNIPVEDDEEDD